MNFTKPENVGISSENVRLFYKELEKYNLSTHSVSMARGNSIFSECYYAPFNKDFLHRMYSVSKSFVSIAIGFCEQDGLLSLDDPMMKFFPEYVNKEGYYEHLSTVRDLLTMESSIVGVNWFYSGCSDRVDTYFKTAPSKTPGTLFDYDSSGSYMLGVIVERVTGKLFLDYLKEKVLDDIGFSKNSYCIMAPGKNSFGDSGVMCTTHDLLLFARFVLNGGTWNGKRYLNEKYIRNATTCNICNNDFGFYHHGTFGYGYKFWGGPEGTFCMLGMGTQIALCDPRHDFVFAINSDNQGNPIHYELVYKALFDNIISKLSDTPLPEDSEAYDRLSADMSEKALYFLNGNTESDFSEKINGAKFSLSQNRMGIKWIKLDFDNDKGYLHYENAQGVKCIPFGFGYNIFEKFPEENYPDLIATIKKPGNKYDAAFSADWPEEKKLRIRVQVIDKYFGNLAVVISFKDENSLMLRMGKIAEAFLDEYFGTAFGTRA